MRYCTKVSADIDNFFADGDDSTMRLARFVYYVQNIEFEMLMASPARYAIFYKLFHRGLKTLQNGVTKRFVAAEKGLYKLAGKHIPKEIAKLERKEIKLVQKVSDSKKSEKDKTKKPRQSEKSSKATKTKQKTPAKSTKMVAEKPSKSSSKKSSKSKK